MTQRAPATLDGTQANPRQLVNPDDGRDRGPGHGGPRRKERAEVVLLEQMFVIDGESKVSKVVENAAKEAGAPIAVTGFVRFVLGEGIEREADDFASEVAALSGA